MQRTLQKYCIIFTTKNRKIKLKRGNVLVNFYLYNYAKRLLNHYKINAKIKTKLIQRQ